MNLILIIVVSFLASLSTIATNRYQDIQEQKKCIEITKASTCEKMWVAIHKDKEGLDV